MVFKVKYIKFSKLVGKSTKFDKSFIKLNFTSEFKTVHTLTEYLDSEKLIFLLKRQFRKLNL